MAMEGTVNVVVRVCKAEKHDLTDAIDIYIQFSTRSSVLKRLITTVSVQGNGCK